MRRSGSRKPPADSTSPVWSHTLRIHVYGYATLPLCGLKGVEASLGGSVAEAFGIQMERASAVILLCCLSVGALLLGFALCFPFFSFLPLYWGIGLALVFLLCFVACVAVGRRVVGALYLVTGSAYSVIFVVAVTIFTGVERVEQYECDWKTVTGRVEIDLSPIGGFGWSRVSSDELSSHLAKDRPPKVHVEVPITRDFGRVRARGMIKRVDGIPVQEHVGSADSPSRST